MWLLVSLCTLYLFILFAISSLNTNAIALMQQNIPKDDPNNISKAFERLSPVFADTNFNATSKRNIDLGIDLLPYSILAVPKRHLNIFLIICPCAQNRILRIRLDREQESSICVFRNSFYNSMFIDRADLSTVSKCPWDIFASSMSKLSLWSRTSDLYQVMSTDALELLVAKPYQLASSHPALSEGDIFATSLTSDNCLTMLWSSEWPL